MKGCTSCVWILANHTPTVHIELDIKLQSVVAVPSTAGMAPDQCRDKNGNRSVPQMMMDLKGCNFDRRGEWQNATLEVFFP